jgi:para-nitrobenzyl esterase
LRLAEAQAKHTPVYAYLFDWKSPAAGGRVGAGHFVDVPFVFGTYTEPGVARLELDQPGSSDLAAAMQDAWARFARFGSPATPLLPEWLPYEPSLRWTMRLGALSATVNGPAEAERAVWEHGPALPAV